MEKTMMQKLLDAGVSAEVVLKLHMEDEVPAPKEQEKPEDPEEKKKPEDPEEKEKTREPEKQKKPEDPEEREKPAGNMDVVLAAIEKLTGAIQAGNIRGTYTKNTPQTTDDILATILRGEVDEAEEIEGRIE